jgi:hypothetical protein
MQQFSKFSYISFCNATNLSIFKLFNCFLLKYLCLEFVFCSILRKGKFITFSYLLSKKRCKLPYHTLIPISFSHLNSLLHNMSAVCQFQNRCFILSISIQQQPQRLYLVNSHWRRNVFLQCPCVKIKLKLSKNIIFEVLQTFS